MIEHKITTSNGFKEVLVKQAYPEIVQFHPRPQYVNELVLVDGMTRAGKFLLGHIVGSLEGLEFMQYPPLLEIALYLTRLGKLDIDTAQMLVKTDIDLNTYNMMVGRGLNSRVYDASCIYNAADSGRFLARSKEIDTEVLVSDFQAQNRLPLYIGHESLCNGRTLFIIYPEVRLISLQRDPLSLILSWYKRGWGRRFGVDPKSMSVGFKTQFGPVPWFALNWEPGYTSMSEMDRIVKSMETLFMLAKQEYESLDLGQKARVHFVAFDDILLTPFKVVSDLSHYLNRKPLENIRAILERERVPRIIATDQRDLLLKEIRQHMSPGMEPMIQSLISDFDGFWMNLVKKQDENYAAKTVS